MPKNKRMRLPNGFGQISKISSKPLRNPYRAMITEGWSHDGKPIRRSLGYFHTYNDAYAALLDHHRSPKDKASDMTVSDLYLMWSKEHYKKIKSAGHYKAAWKKLSSLSDRNITDLTRLELKETIESIDAPSMKKLSKMILSLMFDYAIGIGALNDNPIRNLPLDIDGANVKHHIRFTANELSLIEKEGGLIADIIIFSSYTGMRPGEVLNIKTSDINMKEHYLVGGSKTKAGINRVVPLCDKAYRIIEKYNGESDSGLLFDVSYKVYSSGFLYLMSNLGLSSEHKPHDTRVTFVSMSREAGCDEYIIKRIIGHHLDDMTERIYARRSISEMLSEVSKLV